MANHDFHLINQKFTAMNVLPAQKQGSNSVFLKRAVFAIIILIAAGTGLFAQTTKTIDGKISDEGGKPLPNVSVVLKKTAKGTTTAADGSFSLSVAPNDVLSI